MALSKLSGDEKLIICYELCNPLLPVTAISFFILNKELWVLTHELRRQLKTDNEAAAAFARKLGLRGRKLGYSDQYACSLLRTQHSITICSERPFNVVCNDTEMELLGKLGSFLPELKFLSVRQDAQFLHFAKSLCAGALPKLTTLSISKTFIGKDGAVALAAAMCRGAMPRLWSISLISAGINDAGLQALVPALRKRTKLGEINLRGNTFGDNGLAALLSLFPFEGVWPRPYPSEGLERKMHMLEFVDISDNNVNITHRLVLARTTKHPLLVDGERFQTHVIVALMEAIQHGWQCAGPQGPVGTL